MYAIAYNYKLYVKVQTFEIESFSIKEAVTYGNHRISANLKDCVLCLWGAG
jgi:hypothetical protein